VTTQPDGEEYTITVSDEAMKQLMDLIAEDPEMAVKIEEAFSQLATNPYGPGSARFCIECDEWIEYPDHQNHPHFEDE